MEILILLASNTITSSSMLFCREVNHMTIAKHILIRGLMSFKSSYIISGGFRDPTIRVTDSL